MSKFHKSPAEQVPAPEWEPCQRGDISCLVSNLRRRCRNRRCGKVAAAGVILLLGLAAYLGVIPGVRFPSGIRSQEVAQPESVSRDPVYGGLACSDLKRLAQDYVRGAVNKMQEHQIQVHLQHCPKCQDYVDSLRAGPVTQRVHSTGEQLTLAGLH